MTSEIYLYKQECYSIIGCCMEVHKELGRGFLEAVYQEALEIVFLEEQIPHVREKLVNIKFRDQTLNKKYVADFLCYNEVIVELKATDGLIDADIAQALNYLKALDKKIALLVNFGTPKLQYKRVIL